MSRPDPRARPADLAGLTEAELLVDVEGTLETIQRLRLSPEPADQVTLSGLARRLGPTALIFSGGGALGFFHLGVARALFEAGLLPQLLAGASMGAMIAAGLAVRTEAELSQAFLDPSWVERRGIRWHGPKELWRHRSLLSAERLFDTVRRNVGEHTFREGHERTGRTLVVAVTSARRGHPIRLLSHRCSPELSIPKAALASGAIPGFFPRVDLDGEHYLDGSFGGDVPIERLANTFGAAHFVVSQVNAFAVPFLGPARIGPVKVVGQVARRTASSAVAGTGHLVRRTPLGSPLALLAALGGQNYTGDLTISPRLSPRLFTRVLANPSPADLRALIDAGAAATQPVVALLQRRDRVYRALLSALPGGAP